MFGVLGFVAGLLMAGCAPSTPKIAVSLSPSSAQTLDQGQTVHITATVANESKKKGVIWSLSPATGAGVLSSTTTTSATYTAPASVTKPTSATVTAKSASDSTKSASLIVNLVPPPAISTTTLPQGNVGTAYSVSLNETGGVAPFTWTIASGSLPSGLTLASSTTNTVNVTGTPKEQGTSTITVKVTDAGGLSATSQSLSIVIGAAAALKITTSSPLPNGSVGTSYSQMLQATGGLQPYTWSLGLGSSLPAGLSLSGSGTISGAPTAAGTTTFTVQVTDSQTPAAKTASSQFSITINNATANACGAPLGNESVLKGEYAFLVQGFQGSGATKPVAIAASFAADGTGKVTAGEEDVNNATAPQHLTFNATGSSYTVGTDNRGCVTLLNSGGTTTTFHFSLGGVNAGVVSRGRIIEFDDSTGNGTRGSGILRLQTKTDFSGSKLSARYAFGLDGFDSTSGHVAIGGAFATGGSGTTISSGYTDVDDAGTLQTGLTGASGMIGAISSATGRATATYNAGASASYNWVVYVVNANEIFIFSSDTLAANKPITSGRAIVTGSSFSNATLNGHYIIHLSGVSGGLAHVNLGLLNLSAGALTGTIREYSLGSTPNAKTTTISGGTYAVNATSGRVTLASVGPNPPVLYLTTPTDGISAFIIGTDNSSIFGLGEFQPAATYSTNSLSGNGGKFFFGTEDPSDNTVKDEVGTVTVTGSTGAISGFQDSSGSTSPFLDPAKSVSGTIVVNADGTGNVGTNNFSVTNGTKLFFIDEGTSSPAKITVVEQ